MEYNYVFYGVTNDFYRHSFADLNKLDYAVALGDFYESSSTIKNWLFKIHTYPQINRYICLPGKSIWNRHCFKFNFNYNRKMCFIFGEKYYNQYSFFEYLRKQFPGCKLVLSFRDLVSKDMKRYQDMNPKEFKDHFDIVMSYNKYDCEKYGMYYFDLEASKEDIEPAEDYPWSDVVFIAKAKDRMDKVYKAYDILSSAGLKCFFYIVGNPKQFEKHGDIIITDEIMTYSKMLEHTINSKCILELSQSDEYGFTSRAQEAFMYNKRLITDSLIVKEQPFYSVENVQFIRDTSEIDPSFVKNEKEVNYGYNGEYSPTRMIQLVEKLIKEQ